METGRRCHRIRAAHAPTTRSISSYGSAAAISAAKEMKPLTEPFPPSYMETNGWDGLRNETASSTVRSPQSWELGAESWELRLQLPLRACDLRGGGAMELSTPIGRTASMALVSPNLKVSDSLSRMLLCVVARIISIAVTLFGQFC